VYSKEKKTMTNQKVLRKKKKFPRSLQNCSQKGVLVEASEEAWEAVVRILLGTPRRIKRLNDERKRKKEGRQF